MPAANFATSAKHGPNPCATTHTDNNPTAYTCHMAAMHWAFMDLGDTDANANAKAQAIIQAKCQGCLGTHHMHGSILPAWYGTNFCGGAVQIANRAALYAAVNVGDVLITAQPQQPMHSMVIVSKKTMLGRHFVYVRGFNNTNTLGAGPFLQYDNSDRDIDKDKFWHSQAGITRFGLSFSTGGALHRIPYGTYSASAAVVRNNCNNAAGPWVYAGP
jgi:hypothetical protein